MSGSAAGWSGADNVDVAVDRRTADQRAAAQGDILTDASVVDAALAAFSAGGGPLADPVYVHTDASVLGVDPDSTEVPSVFVSVLVERGGDRAPDRLADVGASADRSTERIVVQGIDQGADTAARRLRTLTLAVIGIVVAAAVVGSVLFVRSHCRRRRFCRVGRPKPTVLWSGS